MLNDLVPVKTADGHAELAQRVRGLSQRHRTVLLLVDGRRSLQQVRAMAAAAGVPAQVFDELVALGLVRTVPPTSPGELAPPEPLPSDDSLLPAAASLLPESEHGAFVDIPLDPVPDELVDGPLEQARELLQKALRNEAPVSGSLLMMRLRRAGNRQEVAAMLGEIEQRIRKPRKKLLVDQLLRQVKYLLSLPPAEP
ncbi:MAG: hypothetical protein AB1430_24125 [Pseudomonadota bacterium]